MERRIMSWEARNVWETRHTSRIPLKNRKTLSYEEVKRALGKLKNNKAPGQDGIPTELLRYGGKTLTSALYELIENM